MKHKGIVLQRSKTPVRVKMGEGGGAPKVILQRSTRAIALQRMKTPVRIEVGAGGGAPKVALERSARTKQIKSQ